MRHIRYMTTRETVCDMPAKLGTDWLVLENSDEFPCDTCTALVDAHNLKEARKEAQTGVRYEPPSPFNQDDPMQMVRGFLTGCVFSTGFYITLYLMLHFLFGWL